MLYVHAAWTLSSQFTFFCIASTIIVLEYLLNNLNSVDRTLLNLSDLSLVNFLLYGGPQFHDTQNAFILNSSIKIDINL